MTDGLDQALTAAAFDLLAADPTLPVYDGDVPAEATPPYVLVYSHLTRPADDPSNSMDGQKTLWTVRWITHCVGGGPGAVGGAAAVAARAVAQRVRAALLGVRPTVAGMSCGQIEMEDSSPPQRDVTSGPVLMDAVVTYRMTAST